MSQNELAFTVLLDKIEGDERRGLKLGGGELRAARLYREGTTGVADSVQAVQEAGLLQVPTYAYFNGRSFVGLDDPVWVQYHDGLGERLVLGVAGNYRDVPQGEWVVDVQGGGLFMPRPKLVRNAVRDQKLVNGAMPISQEDKDLLLGERYVHRWNGQTLEMVHVKYFFTSFEQFQDVSGTQDFQEDLRDLSAVYVVLRPATEARTIPSGVRSISDQLENPDLIIPAGSKDRLRKMFMEKEGDSAKEVPQFKWRRFGSWHDSYATADTGRVGVLRSSSYNGVYFNGSLNDGGGSGGVAPEALRGWRAAREKSLEKRVK